MSDVHQQKIQYLVSTAKCRKLEALIDASLPPKGIVPIDALIASIDRAALKSRTKQLAATRTPSRRPM